MYIQAASTAKPTSARRSALSTITMAALTITALLLIYFQAVLLHHVEIPLTIAAGLFVLTAGLTYAGWRWAPLLGALLGALVIAGRLPNIIADLSHPEAFQAFSYIATVVTCGIVMIIAGVAATVQRLRSAETRAPRGTAIALAATIAFVAGLIASAAIPRPAGAGIDLAALAGLPAVTIPGMHFEQTELHATVGQVVALRLENDHTVAHSFDIDELNVHVAAAPGQQSLILFQPTEPGTYTFYCALPGHREAGMTGTLIVAQ